MKTLYLLMDMLYTQFGELGGVHQEVPNNFLVIYNEQREDLNKIISHYFLIT